MCDSKLGFSVFVFGVFGIFFKNLRFLVVIGKIVFVFSGDRRSGLERWFNITIHSAILILTKTKRKIITSVIEYLFGYFFIL